MPLSKKTIEEFRRAYEKDFKQKLSFEQARRMAGGFLHFLYWLAQASEAELSTDGDLTERSNNELMDREDT